MGQAKGERRTFTFKGLDGHIAAMVHGDMADNGQSEPGTPRIAGPRPVDTVETLEDPLAITARNTDALVGDGDPDSMRRFVRAGAHHDREPLVAVLDRVLEEVVDGRHQLGPFPDHRETQHDRHDLDGYAVTLAARLTSFDGLVHQVAHEQRDIARRIIGLDTRQREEVVDHRRQAIRLEFDARRQLANDRRILVVGAVAKGFGKQEQGAYRSAQFVADVRDEITSDSVDAASLRHVFDDGNRSVKEAGPADHDDPARRSVELDGLGRGEPTASLGQHFAECRHGHSLRRMVSQQRRRGLISGGLDAADVGDYQSELQMVEASQDSLLPGAEFVDRPLGNGQVAGVIGAPPSRDAQAAAEPHR